MSDVRPTPHPSRRTVMKSAVAVGALSVWTVPVVESFAMTSASADTVSGAPSVPPATLTPRPTVTDSPSTDPTPGAGQDGLGGGGNPAPSFEIDATEVTASDVTGTPTASASGAALAGGRSAAGAGAATLPGNLASTGLEFPAGITTAVGVGAMAVGVAAVVAGKRSSTATSAADDPITPQGPRRH